MDDFKQAELNRWISAVAAQVIHARVPRTGPPAHDETATPGAASRPAGPDTPYAPLLSSWAAVAGFAHDLPTHQREVLQLHLDRGLSYRQIAATLGVSLGTVHSRIARARKRLQSAVHRHQAWAASRSTESLAPPDSGP